MRRVFVGEVVSRVYRDIRTGEYEAESEVVFADETSLGYSLLTESEAEHAKTMRNLGVSRIVEYFSFMLNPEKQAQRKVTYKRKRER